MVCLRHTSYLVSGFGVRCSQSLPHNPWTHHFPLRTPEVKVKVAYSVVGGHFELLVGVSVQHGAPRYISRFPRHSEAFLIVQRQSDVLPVQRATWESKREERPLKTELGGSKGVKKQIELGGWCQSLFTKCKHIIKRQTAVYISLILCSFSGYFCFLPQSRYILDGLKWFS